MPHPCARLILAAGAAAVLLTSAAAPAGAQRYAGSQRYSPEWAEGLIDQAERARQDERERWQREQEDCWDVLTRRQPVVEQRQRERAASPR